MNQTQPPASPGPQKQVRGFRILLTHFDSEGVELICLSYKSKDGVLILDQGESGTVNIPFTSIRAWRAIPVILTQNQPATPAAVVEVQKEEENAPAS